MKGRGRNTVEAYVEVNLDDELDDEMLMKMARERGLIGGDADDAGAMGPREWWEMLAQELRTAARNNEHVHFEVLLHRMVNTAAPRPIFVPTDKSGRLHA